MVIQYLLDSTYLVLKYTDIVIHTTLIMLISVVYTNFLLKAITSYAKWIFLPIAKLLMLLKKNDFYK
jgi:hypothetical protein